VSDAPTETLYEETGMGRALPRGVRPAALVVEANLFQAKYADVVLAGDALAYLAATAASRNGDET